MKHVALVGCSKTKVTAPGVHEARSLYKSPLFRAAMNHADTHFADRFILSAKYGILFPHEAVRTYDLSLNDVGAAERAAWGKLVAAEVQVLVPAPATLVAFCGETYIAALEPHLAGYTIERPLRGLGIGERMAWFARAAKGGA